MLDEEAVRVEIRNYLYNHPQDKGDVLSYGCYSYLETTGRFNDMSMRTYNKLFDDESRSRLAEKSS